MDKWTKTDDMQFVYKKSEKEFDVIDILEHEDNYFCNYCNVNLNDYDDNELKKEVSSYYKDLSELKNIYGVNSNQIIAECIAEQITIDEGGKIFNSIQKVNKWLGAIDKGLFVE